MELFKVVTINETKKIIDDNFKYTLGRESVNLFDAVSRILSRDVVSEANVPDFRRSTVDGYAVSSKDVFGASEAIPSILDLAGEVIMGEIPSGEIDFPGHCYYVPTGGMLPGGADAVVMIEYTEKMDEKTVLVNSPVAPLENVVEVGEDIGLGEIVLKSGTRLRPYEIGVLSSLGISDVEVYKKPRIGIISTGDEVIECSESLTPGKIRDINTYLLYSLSLENGGMSISYGIIKDDYKALKEAVNRAVSECDIVLISGGSSVGKKDQTLRVIKSFGEENPLVHGISVKPGKPTIVGRAGDKIMLGLPGHPLACALMFKLLVKYYMDKLTGLSENLYPVPAIFSINYHKAKGREEYLPVNLRTKGEELIAEPVFGKSGLITAFSRAWGYVRIEKNEEGLRENQRVFVYKF